MQIANVQRLRALAAVMVVIGHAQTAAMVAAVTSGGSFRPLNLLPWGAGVDLFFVISGFIMVVSSERLFAQPDGQLQFAARRLKRIVPLYWLFTTLYVVIQVATHKRVDSLDLLASYGFWPRDVYGDGTIHPMFQLGWTLNYEMFFYAVFACAIRLPVRRAVALVTMTLASGVVVGQIWPLAADPLHFWTQPIVLEFVLGMGLGLAWRNGMRLPDPARFGLAVLAMALLVHDFMNAAGRPSGWTTPTDMTRMLAWGVPCAILFAAAAFGRDADRQIRLRFGVIALGNASYALYLVHPFIIAVLVRIWMKLGVGDALGFWLFVPTSVALAIIAGFTAHAWLEKPLGRLLAFRYGAPGPTGVTTLAGPSALMRSGGLSSGSMGPLMRKSANQGDDLAPCSSVLLGRRPR